jgi:hypothetical protein
MVESSDLQAAIQRTQALERAQQLQSQQQEMSRKRFELEMEHHRAERARRVAEGEKASEKRVERDRYDHEEREQAQGERHPKAGAQPPKEDEPPQGGTLDVRI